MQEVTYTVCSSSFRIHKQLKKLSTYNLLSFDTETRGIYTQEEVAEAKELLKSVEELSLEDMKFCRLVASNSGLSFPSMIQVTHFIFGTSLDHTIILITETYNEELMVWNWLAKYKGKLLIHNALFDLKIMYQRIGKYPVDYEDTSLRAKSLINDCDVWKAKVGLKELVGSYYKPSWSLYNDYSVKDLRNVAFLEYCAIDGSAVLMLNDMLNEMVEEMKNA